MPTLFEQARERCVLIAEVAQNHDGSLGGAHAYIDAAAKAGADAVKFQTHIAAAESTQGEPWRVPFSRQDASRYDYWRRIEFTPAQWADLAAHARESGLCFLSSAFSEEAVELLDSIGMEAWKVGAGEIATLPLLQRMARTKKPLLLSSGLAGWSHLDAAVDVARDAGTPYGVFQCTTMYPCPPEKLGLNVLEELRERYACPVGLSDHSGTIYAGLAAAAMGANMIEVHITFSRECFGPDVIASITTGELRELAEGIRFINTAQRNPVDKNAMADELSSLREVFGKSVVAVRDLPAGTILGTGDLTLKKPGTGLPASRLGEVLQRRLARSVAADTLLSEEDLEQEKTT